MITLRLIRHPKPDVAPGLCYGALDVPADAADLTRLVTELAQTNKPTYVYSSPLQRCRLTAQALHELGWPQPQFDARIAEMNFGDWEGQLWDNIDRAQIDAWRANIADHVPPGGESVRAIAQRALAFARDLQTTHRLPGSQGSQHPSHAPAEHLEIAVFTHAGIIQTLPRIWRAEPLSGFAGTRIDYGSTTELILT